MTTAPNYIEIRSQSRTTQSIDRGLPSPRLHVAGEVPPTLSPLDAFAAQSRLLAKQLSESENDGRRISRLPTLAIAETISQQRPDHLQAASIDEHAKDSASVAPQSAPTCGKPEVEASAYRPVSVYPFVTEMPPPALSHHVNDDQRSRGRLPLAENDGTGYFGLRRTLSPGSLDRERNRPRAESQARPRPSIESLRQHSQGGWRPEALAIGPGYRALALPRSPFAGRTPSPRSMVSVDSLDDDFFMSSGPPTLSPRRQRSGSAFSTSTNSPSMLPYLPRSPSASSEISAGGTRLQRPALNFSRPISRQSEVGTPIDTPSRQASSDSQPSFILADDTANTPVSIHSDGFPNTSDEIAAAPSYVYSRFTLPRGKTLQRNSLICQNQPSASLHCEISSPESDSQPIHGAPPPSPPSRPSTSSIRSETSNHQSSMDRASLERTMPSSEQILGVVPSQSESRPDHVSSASTSSASTIKANTLAPSAESSADEHVSKGIEYHENGALTKSTYHLRLAARQNHPTGMLLYALACRHGWGMRPNQKEGVSWLRKAMDSAGLEVADDENMVKDGKIVNILETKARRSQFALAIYELGVSHLNGWGIEQDKMLALRCFEIAGSWGDADALAEAGFCYAQGVGCKKDLKKSAKFYRQAEKKGISMIGNSWIYKPKYSDDAVSETPPLPLALASPEKKLRNKSRTRTMFSRKRPELQQSQSHS